MKEFLEAAAYFVKHAISEMNQLRFTIGSRSEEHSNNSGRKNKNGIY